MPTLVGKPITSNGLGLMRITTPGYQIPDEVAFGVLKTALAKGSNVWNGADFYGPPTSNSLHLMNRYFSKYPEDADKVVLSIKSGVADMRTFRMDCSAENMRNKVDEANKILDGKKAIDIFGPARIDPNVPVETTIQGLATLIKEGKIGGIQLTEVSAETIRRAAKIHKVEMVEEEVSLWSPEIFTNGVTETCAELGITIVAHTPLGAGMLTGQITKLDDLPETDHHRYFPRFQPESFEKNLELVEELKKLAKAKGCTPAQLALSWIKQHNGRPNMPVIVPVAGARSEERVIENCTDIELSEDDLERIAEILRTFPVVGGRWPDAVAKLTEI